MINLLAIGDDLGAFAEASEGATVSTYNKPYECVYELPTRDKHRTDEKSACNHESEQTSRFRGRYSVDIAMHRVVQYALRCVEKRYPVVSLP